MLVQISRALQEERCFPTASPIHQRSDANAPELELSRGDGPGKRVVRLLSGRKTGASLLT